MPTEITTSATRDSTRPNPCCLFFDEWCIVLLACLRRAEESDLKRDGPHLAEHLGAAHTVDEHDARGRERARGHARPAVVAQDHRPVEQGRITRRNERARKPRR